MHDRNGDEVKVGDQVIVRATVQSITPNPGFCNCTVKLDVPMPDDAGRPASYSSTVTVNCKQVELAARPAPVIIPLATEGGQLSA